MTVRHAEPGAGRRRPASYYGVPPLHKPHWKWLIVSYFYLGGVSAGSYVMATVAELFGPREDHEIVRVGRYLAALVVIPCPVLLVLDLGRPGRFLNMLRVLKLRSPMSLGSWGLLVYGTLATLSAGGQAARDGRLGARVGALRRAPIRLIGAIGSLFGCFIGGYTGVLLGATAVPIWAKNARLLGPLFLSSALASACAAISLVLALRPGRHERSLERLHLAESVATTGEIVALAAIHVRSGSLGAPLSEGSLARLHLTGSVGLGIAAPLVLHAVGPKLGLPRRLVAVVAAAASLVGGFVVKYVVVMAGHASADDPAATFAFAGGNEAGRPVSAGRR
jgi:formate-dependent nitrite reductase membrane component NrfD